MSIRSESREIGSVDERSSSGANSVTSDDSSERTTTATTTTAKKSEVPRNASLKYSYEFLLKLQKSKLSKKPPECIDRLRQECILRETWRSDREKDSERETEFPAALTKPPPSFRGGCKVDKAVLSDNPNPGSNSVKKSAASKGERRVGSGRLGSYNKDRESDYGYPQDRSRRLFDHQGNEPLKRSNGRYVEMNSHRGGGPADDEPEWFTEGPTSQNDTIELGGFDREEKPSRKVRTPSPSVRKPTVNVDSQPEPEGVDLLKELYDMGNGPRKSAPINFEQFFGNSHDDGDDHDHNVVIEDEAIQAVPHAGSRFMSKVFAKTFEDESSPSSKPASPPIHAKDLETSPRPVLELLKNSEEPPPSSSMSSLLRDMYSSAENHRSAMQGPPGQSYDSLEDLLSRSAQQQQHHHHRNNMVSNESIHLAGPMHSSQSMLPPPTTVPSTATSTISSSTNNVLDVENGVQGKMILEMLMSGANAANVPSTPHFAKSVEELEADLKMESSRMSSNAMFGAPAGAHPAHHHQQQQQPPLGSRSMMTAATASSVMGNGAMERSLGLMSELQSSVAGHNSRHPNSFASSQQVPSRHSPSLQQQQAYQQQIQPQQRQQQANSTHNNASLDIMRLLMEGATMPEREQGKPYKQDVRNVPTSVLLQDKQRKSGLQAGGPRPIVKRNKNPPPCPPPTAPSSVAVPESGEDLLQRLFQQQQHEQQFAHHQYQQHHQHHPQQHPQQQYHHHPQQQQQAHQQQQRQAQFASRPFGYGGGVGGATGFNGNSAPSQQMRSAPSNRRPLTGGHGQRFPSEVPSAFGSSGPVNSHAANIMNPGAGPEQPVIPDDALARWFGNLSCNQPSLPVPTNVLRVEELERQNNGHRVHQAKPTAT